MHLVVGLGNPGQEYQWTRHNVGFRVLDDFGYRYGWKWRKAKRFAWTHGKIDGHEIYLVKPLTYMNLSGMGLLSFFSFTAKSFEKKIIVHDELDLPPGEIRISRRGGTAGHRGLYSIAEFFDIKDFIRIRVGIGKPIQKDDVVDYVLDSPGEEEHAILAESEKKAVDALICLITYDVQTAMNRFN